MTSDQPTEDPVYHTRRIKQEIGALVDHLRQDADEVDDPSARALFETSAEVLIGLKNAFDHYEESSEEGWRG